MKHALVNVEVSYSPVLEQLLSRKDSCLADITSTRVMIRSVTSCL